MPAELLKVSAGTPETAPIHYAAEFIKRGLVVGVPTDTFYGLAADPFNLAAVEEIYRVKGRPENRALPILVNSIEQAAILGRDLPLNFLKLAQKFWPGALTIVVEASQSLPLKVTANKGRVALRWPNSPRGLRDYRAGGLTDYRDEREYFGFSIVFECPGTGKTAGGTLATDPGWRRYRRQGFIHDCEFEWREVADCSRRQGVGKRDSKRSRG